MQVRILFLLSILWTGQAHAKLHTFLGVHKSLKEVQDSDGKVEDKPFSPVLNVGYHFNLFDSGFGFSPQLGYIHNKVISKDDYGAQKVHSLFLLWDFFYVPEEFNNFGLRFGIGNFMKRIQGEGGTITVPNGNGTDTALRPGGTVTSYSSTFNLGADYNFRQHFDLGFEGLGLRTELFIFRPLSSENRNYSFILGALLYF